MKKGTTGVMLLNLGGPDSLQAVRPFLYNLFSDRRIIRLGPAFMQKHLAWLISTLRAPKARNYYRLIGGRSPILGATRAQAEALEPKLREHGDFSVYLGMSYWHPFIEDVAEQARRDGVERLISLSLYPQYSVATTGSSEASLEEALGGLGVECSFISSWYDHPMYIDALEDVISRGLAGNGGAHVLFSAHSLPVRFIEEGDPYADEVKGTVEAVMRRIKASWRLGYQSKTGPVRWLGPSTEEVLRGLASEGVKDVLVVPVSFVSDHIETLYEIDILYKGVAESLGIRLRRVESLNAHPRFIMALSDLVLKRAKELHWL
jgi:ferrochelatase